jgi:hypothetical protein
MFKFHLSSSPFKLCVWRRLSWRPFHRENRMHPAPPPIPSTWGFGSHILSDGLFVPICPRLNSYSCSLGGLKLKLMLRQARLYIEPSCLSWGLEDRGWPSLSRFLWPVSQPRRPTVLSLTLFAKLWVILTVFIPLACRNLQGSSRLRAYGRLTWHQVVRCSEYQTYHTSALRLTCLLDGATVIGLFRRSLGCSRTHRRLFWTWLLGAYPHLISSFYYNPQINLLCKWSYKRS